MTMSELSSSNNSGKRDFSIDSIIGKNSNKGGTKIHRQDATAKGSEHPPKSAFGSVSPNSASLHDGKSRLPISVSPKTMTAVSRSGIRVPEAIHSQTPAPHPNALHYNMDPRMFMSGRQPLVHPLQQLFLNQEMMNSNNGNMQPAPWNYERLAAGLYHPGLTVPPNPAFLFHPYRKPKRVRTAFTPNQLLQLEKSFEKNHYVVGQERKDLALELKLSETQVKVWFQNRRTKYKRTKSEDDPSGCNGETTMFSSEESFKDDEDISVDSDDVSEFDENELNMKHDFSASER